MPCTRLTTIAVTLTAMSMAGPAFAQALAPAQPAPASPPAAAPSPAPAAPLFATTKVEGTDNVYVFRYQNHQSMFVVTPAGVIATDPISYGRPQAATDLSRRDPQDHQGADQVPDLQPPPLRPCRRRQAVQGGGGEDRRPSRAPRSGWRR